MNLLMDYLLHGWEVNPDESIPSDGKYHWVPIRPRRREGRYVPVGITPQPWNWSDAR